jgi:iron-sulfur cluster assembly protein
MAYKITLDETVSQAYTVSAHIIGEKFMITLSEVAAKEIKSIIQEQGLAQNVALRVGVKGGGCSGFTYVLDLTEAPPTADGDEVMDSHGIKILSDHRSYLYLNGTEIDFKDEIMGRGFVFKNPNATHTCGCGSSFAA